MPEGMDPITRDFYEERRRRWRRSAFWRGFLVAAVIAGVIAILFSGGPEVSDEIARVSVEGLITDDPRRDEMLDRIAESGRIRAVVVRINSPGGTTAGSEELYDALTRLKAKKPMVVVVEGLGASGGYIAALASDHIVAQQTALVGSIGVLFQYPNFTDLLKTVGVKVEEVKSSPLKAAPNGYEPTSPEARAAIEALVKDSYGWFRGMVKERRKMDGTALETVTDGRVFTGRQALALRLVDQLGNEKTAVAWLATEKGLKADTPVRDWQLKPRLSDLSVLHLAAAALLDAVGLNSLAQRIEGSVQAVERLNLDGLLALWHPPMAN